jgi:hypothetical protein
MLETQILQLILHPPDSDAIGQRRIDVQRLFGNFLTFSFRQMLQRSHVMEPIRQLDDHNADIIRHRQHHFAEVFSLLFFGTLKGNLPDLGDTIDQMHHFLAELPLELIRCRNRIF